VSALVKAGWRDVGEHLYNNAEDGFAVELLVARYWLSVYVLLGAATHMVAL
jgi:hypothetical protein